MRIASKLIRNVVPYLSRQLFKPNVAITKDQAIEKLPLNVQSRKDYSRKRMGFIFNSERARRFKQTLHSVYDESIVPPRVLLFFGTFGFTLFIAWLLKKCQTFRKEREEEAILIKSPTFATYIPEKVPYVIIGGGETSYEAYQTIKKYDSQARVLVISDEMKHVDWKGEEIETHEVSAFERDPAWVLCDSLRRQPGVAVARGWKVQHIDPLHKVLTLEDNKTVQYQQCLLATGSVVKELPFLHQRQINQTKKVFYYKGKIDDEILQEVFSSKEKKVLVIGGQVLAAELISNMKHLEAKHETKLKLLQVFKEKTLMEEVLPASLGYSITEKLKAKGVIFLPGKEVVSIKESTGGVVVHFKDGGRELVDCVIAATKMVPNTELAEASGLEIDKQNGGIVANQELQVRGGLYVAGPNASYYTGETGRKKIVGKEAALMSGRLAALNMVGKSEEMEAHMRRVVLTNVAEFVEIGDVQPSYEKVAQYPEVESGVVTPVAERVTKGVVYYLKEGKVVGLLLWNLPGKRAFAEKVLHQNCTAANMEQFAIGFQLK